MAKYVFITGGVVSGIGKGIVATSLGRLLKNRGLKVFLQKFDPYINVDAGTISPYEHGETFVTKDGHETDLDIGHYERFIDEELTKNANITAGRVYLSVINKERRGDYLGTTVQVVPHITDEIKKKITEATLDSQADVVITEIGGTVGDIESLPFLEAVRQFHGDAERNDVVIIHTALIPVIPGSDEQKTKPIQHSYKELMGLGIKPNIIVTRSEHSISKELKQKIAMFCNVRENAIIESLNVDNIYEIPLAFEAQGLDDYVLHKLGLDLPPADMSEWKKLIQRASSLKHTVTVGLVGKYIQVHDAYISVVEALKHAGYEKNTDIDIKWINSEDVNDYNVSEYLADCDGVLIPGGFGGRGIEGKISAIKYARQQQVPLFGIGLGLQLIAVEIARHVLGCTNANSTEFDPETPHPIVQIMEDYQIKNHLGGSLRLGNWPCRLDPQSRAFELYQEVDIEERHRHRYEFNNAYRQALTEAGLDFVGLSPEQELVKVVEIKNHPFFMGCQFHPEYKSRPNRSHPLFNGFIEASLAHRLNKK